MGIVIKYCNNIDYGTLNLVKNTLNIKNTILME